MAKSNRRLRDFEVYTHRGVSSSARVIKEYSVEGATAAFLEELGLALHPDENELMVYVRDLKEMSSHCFRIYLGTGKVKECN